MGKYKLVVHTNPTPGMEQEYRRWYIEEHLPDVLDVPGFESAQLFDLRPPPLDVEGLHADGEKSKQWTCIAIYDIETDDIDAAWNDLHLRVGTDKMPISPALGKNVQPMLAIPVGDVVYPRKASR